MIDIAEFKGRYVNTREIMDNMDIDALCLSPSADMYYLTGFWTEPSERLFLCILPKEGEPMFLVSKLYEEQIKNKTWIKNIAVWSEAVNIETQLKNAFNDLDLLNGKMAVPNRLWLSHYKIFQKTAPKVEFISSSEVLGHMRMLKSDIEIKLMEKASELAEGALAATFPLLREWQREFELAACLEYEMRVKGSEGSAFETMVASGSNSAIPHYGSGDRRIREGEFVTFDIGATYGRYCSDMTRTFAVGKVTTKMEKVYNAVYKAHQEAIKIVQPGVTSEAIDLSARRVINDCGYGDYFIHRTGHGVGLELHELPYISERNQTKIQPGMTFSIEPGVYIPGEFGVRIEDVVVVTEDGSRPLTKYPSRMIIT